MKIIFAGGGSGGPVSPLLAIYEQLKKINPDIKAVWVGTKKGPEKKMVKSYDLDFRIVASGKLRRYFSGWNLIAPFKILFGSLQSLILLKQEKPDIVLSAGGFSAVPVFIAAKFLKIPSITHQQDIQPGLANKIMAKLAAKITVTFEKSLKDYIPSKTVLISNPVREQVFSGSKEKAAEFFNLKSDKKTILITGGGQGADIINKVVLNSLDKLAGKYQIIHLTGTANKINNQISQKYNNDVLQQVKENYRSFEFLNKEMFDALQIADIVISRAGMGTLTELSVLGKPAVLIPIPGHQQVNAQYFSQKNAVKVLPEENFDSDNLVQLIDSLFNNQSDLANLSRNISQMIDKNAAIKYAQLITKMLNN